MNRLSILPPAATLVAALAAALAPSPAHAQAPHHTAQAQTQPPGPAVSLQGSLGAQAALLVIDGQPQTLRVGDSARGVRLVSMGADGAVVEANGRRQTLVMGAAQVRLGAGGPGAARQIVLSADPRGHFITEGQINGHAVQMMVDTGATTVALSQADAERMKLPFRRGQQVLMQTANGVVPAHRILLDSVRVGAVEVRGVEAMVVPAAMSQVLLGNSFLNRFQMKREDSVLTLDQRY